MNIDSDPNPETTAEQADELEAAMNAAGLSETPLPPVEKKDDEPIVIDEEQTAPPETPGDEGKKKEDAPDPAEEQTAPPEKKDDPTATATPEDKAKAIEEIDLDKIEVPANISKANTVNFKKLTEVSKHYKGKAAELTSERDSLRAENETLKKNTSGIPENIQKELDDHRAFRRVFDAENSPEFKEKFDSKISENDDAIFGILKKNGLPKEAEDAIRQVGLGKISQDYFQKEILDKLPAVDRNRIEKRLADRADLEDSKKTEAEKFTGQREEFLKKQEEEESAKLQDYEKQVYSHLDTLTKGLEWTKAKEIPAGATAAQKKEIETHNAYVENLETAFRDALFPQTPQERATVAATAVAATQLASQVNYYKAELKTATDKIKEVTEKLEKIKSAGRIPGSQPSGATPQGTDDKDLLKMDSEDAVDLLMKQAGM